MVIIILNYLNENRVDELKSNIASSKTINFVDKKDKRTLEKKCLKINSSILIKEDEFDIIKEKIEEIMNLKIKEINKIYQATIDGGKPADFHKKCDGVKYTLVFFESKGKRRFGGFASESWESKSIHKADKKCFLFSIDKRKIFTIKDQNYYQIACGAGIGPSFIHDLTYCIALLGNAFDVYSLRTVESIHNTIFNGENNILSEDGHYSGTSLKECEVFSIIF